jgi:flavin reductase (DIM6/NTAB) family NADH-FMN oxidoreductase RutF
VSGADAFEGIAAELDYPMYVVTAAAGGERSGCLAGFGTQCSIDPVRFLICVSKANHTFDLAGRAGTLVVHLLRGGDRELAELFGTETGDEIDKFTRCSWEPGPDDAPVLDGLDWFAGRVLARHDVGDHVAMVLELVAGSHDRHAPQLGFQALRDLDPGHDA